MTPSPMFVVALSCWLLAGLYALAGDPGWTAAWLLGCAADGLSD